MVEANSKNLIGIEVYFMNLISFNCWGSWFQVKFKCTHTIDETLLMYHKNSTSSLPSLFHVNPMYHNLYFRQHPAEDASKHLYSFDRHRWPQKMVSFCCCYVKNAECYISRMNNSAPQIQDCCWLPFGFMKYLFT